jgi:hypothetical protein
MKCGRSPGAFRGNPPCDERKAIERKNLVSRKNSFEELVLLRYLTYERIITMRIKPGELRRRVRVIGNRPLFAGPLERVNVRNNPPVRQPVRMPKEDIDGGDKPPQHQHSVCQPFSLLHHSLVRIHSRIQQSYFVFSGYTRSVTQEIYKKPRLPGFLNLTTTHC